MMGQQHALYAVTQHALQDITRLDVGAHLQAAVYRALFVQPEITRLDALGSQVAHVLPVTRHVLPGVTGLLALGQTVEPVNFVARAPMVRLGLDALVLLLDLV